MCRGVAQLASALALGARGCQFESGRPDHFFLVFKKGKVINMKQLFIFVLFFSQFFLFSMDERSEEDFLLIPIATPPFNELKNNAYEILSFVLKQNKNVDRSMTDFLKKFADAKAGDLADKIMRPITLFLHIKKIADEYTRVTSKRRCCALLFVISIFSEYPDIVNALNQRYKEIEDGITPLYEKRLDKKLKKIEEFFAKK